jgi:hypothetical protein
MCTAMLFDPANADAKVKATESKLAPASSQLADKPKMLVTPDGDLVHHRRRKFKGNMKLFERWVRFKQFVLLKSYRRKTDGGDNAGKKRSLLSLFFW